MMMMVSFISPCNTTHLHVVSPTVYHFTRETNLNLPCIAMREERLYINMGSVGTLGFC